MSDSKIVHEIRDLDACRANYRENHGLVVIENFLRADQLRICQQEISKVRSAGMRKDFAMPHSDYTPRHMTVIGGKTMNSCDIIMDLYRVPHLRCDLSYIIGENVSDCPSLDENVIATFMEEPGDTHGWHLDDYPVALIICVESPSFGGRVEAMLAPNKIFSIDLQPGDAYLLRSDKIIHRVCPIGVGSSRRVIINYTYSFHGKPVIPNGSAGLLCC